MAELNGNYSSSPLLHGFAAGLNRNALDHARDKFVDDLLFEQFAADIHAGGTGGGNPEFGHFVVGVELEAVYKAEFLNRAHRDRRKDAEVGQDGEQTAKSEACALGGRHLHSCADDVDRHGVKLLNLDRIHAVKRGDGNAVCGLHLYEKSGRIDSYGVVGVRKATLDGAFDSSLQPALVSLVH